MKLKLSHPEGDLETTVAAPTLLSALAQVEELLGASKGHGLAEEMPAIVEEFAELVEVLSEVGGVYRHADMSSPESTFTLTRLA